MSSWPGSATTRRPEANRRATEGVAPARYPTKRAPKETTVGPSGVTRATARARRHAPTPEQPHGPRRDEERGPRQPQYDSC